MIEHVACECGSCGLEFTVSDDMIEEIGRERVPFVVHVNDFPGACLALEPHTLRSSSDCSSNKQKSTNRVTFAQQVHICNRSTIPADSAPWLEQW